MKNRYLSFNDFLQTGYGERVHKLSLDGGFSCPNIDGTLSNQGCFFCNNRAFNRYAYSEKEITSQIEESILRLKKRFGVRKFIAYFQGFTSTYAPIEELQEKFDAIRKYPEIIGLSVSTRPESISLSREKIDLIAGYASTHMVWIEYGLQSANNQTLIRINRNHTRDDFAAWVSYAKEKGILVAAHVILGLPDETRDDMLQTMRFLSLNSIDGVKFHAFHILSGTVFESGYKEGKITVSSRDAYVSWICDCLELLPKNMVILRLVSDADKKYLVAPSWVNEKQRVISDIQRELEARNSYQGRCSEVL